MALQAFMLEMGKASCTYVDDELAATSIQLAKTTDELEHNIGKDSVMWAADFAALCLLDQPSRIEKALAKKVDKS